MYTKLAYPSFLLEVHGAEIPQGRVTARRIVEALDIVEHIGPCLIPRPVGFSRDAFGFQRREEAFHRSIVPAVAGPAHRAGDAIVRQQQLEVLAGILGGFNRSLQHPDQGGCDEGSQACFGSVYAQEATFAWTSPRMAA